MKRSFAAWACLSMGLSLSAPVAAAKKPQARVTKPAAKASQRPAPPPRDRYPAVALFGAHVHEALAYRPFDDKGRARKDAPRALERLLRCRQTGAKHRLHPRLGDALYQIGRHFAGHRVEIFSGYRPRAYCTRAHSRHMTGSAIDFHVEGIDNETLIAFLRRTFHPAGVGFYPHGVHVHLDLDRSIDTYWVDAPPPAREELADPQIAASADDEPAQALPAMRDTAPAELAEPEAELAEPPDSDPILDATPELPEQQDKLPQAED